MYCSPEKIEKIPVKDNNSYIPLSYSFREEEEDLSKETVRIYDYKITKISYF